MSSNSKMKNMVVYVDRPASASNNDTNLGVRPSQVATLSGHCEITTPTLEKAAGIQARVGIILVLHVLYMGTALVFSQICHSICLLIDAYQSFFIIGGLLICLFDLKKPRRNSSRQTFSWGRVRLLGQVANMVFLVSLLFSQFVEAIQTFLHGSHDHTLHSPIYALVLGATKFFLCTVTVIVFRSAKLRLYSQSPHTLLLEKSRSQSSINNNNINDAFSMRLKQFQHRSHVQTATNELSSDNSATNNSVYPKVPNQKTTITNTAADEQAESEEKHAAGLEDRLLTPVQKTFVVSNNSNSSSSPTDSGGADGDASPDTKTERKIRNSPLITPVAAVDDAVDTNTALMMDEEYADDAVQKNPYWRQSPLPVVPTQQQHSVKDNNYAVKTASNTTLSSSCPRLLYITLNKWLNFISPLAVMTSAAIVLTLSDPDHPHHSRIHEIADAIVALLLIAAIALAIVPFALELIYHLLLSVPKDIFDAGGVQRLRECVRDQFPQILDVHSLRVWRHDPYNPDSIVFTCHVVLEHPERYERPPQFADELQRFIASLLGAYHAACMTIQPEFYPLAQTLVVGQNKRYPCQSVCCEQSVRMRRRKITANHHSVASATATSAANNNNSAVSEAKNNNNDETHSDIEAGNDSGTEQVSSSNRSPASRRSFGIGRNRTKSGSSSGRNSTNAAVLETADLEIAPLFSYSTYFKIDAEQQESTSPLNPTAVCSHVQPPLPVPVTSDQNDSLDALD